MSATAATSDRVVESKAFNRDNELESTAIVGVMGPQETGPCTASLDSVLLVDTWDTFRGRCTWKSERVFDDKLHNVLTDRTFEYPKTIEDFLDDFLPTSTPYVPSTEQEERSQKHPQDSKDGEWSDENELDYDTLVRDHP